MLVLTEADMRSVLDMRGAVDACADAVKAYASGDVDIPLRANLDVADHGGQSLYMPGWVPEADALGIKIVSVYPGNIERGITSVPATMVMLDAETGQVAAVMDGTWLTRQRTGAVAGAATEALARQDAEKFALFGTGGQAATQLEAVLTVRPSIRRVEVSDISTERADDFARRMNAAFADRFDVTVVRAAGPDAAVDGADIITTVTTAPAPVFDGARVAPGAHVNAVGSYTPQMCELDPVVLTRAARIFVDTRDAVVESGDFQQPAADGRFDLADVTGELGDLLLGTVPGRGSDDDITVFESTGNAVLDVVTGRRIHQAALAAGVGTQVAL